MSSPKIAFPKHTLLRSVRQQLSRLNPFHVLIGLTFITMLLRLINVDSRSVWLDESFTLLRIWDSWAAMFANLVHRQGIPTTDIHPFGYFAALKLWAELVGYSSFALRLFNAYGAILTVPLTWALARRYVGKPSALLATGLAVLSPSSQWFSGELRMYTWLPTLALPSLYCLTRAFQDQRRRWWLAWFGATLCGVFVHYSMAGLLIAQAIVAGIWLLRKHILSLRNVFVVLIIGLGLIVFITFTNLGVARQILGSVQSGFFAAADINALIFEVLNGAIFGLNAADPTGQIILWLTLLLIVVGALLKRQWLTRSMLIYLTVPIVMWWVLSLVISNRPTFRYLVFLVPLIQLLPCILVDQILAAQSATRTTQRILQRSVAALVTLCILAPTAFGFVWSFIHTPTWQDDWRAVARTIREHWQDGDVIMGNLYVPEASLLQELNDLPVQFLPSRYIREPELGDTGQQWLREHARRIWYANSGDPDFGQGSEIDAPILALHAEISSTSSITPVLLERYNYGGRSRTVALQLIDLQPWRSDALPADVQATPPESYAHLNNEVNAVLLGYSLSPGNPNAPKPSATLSVFWRYSQSDLAPVNNHKLTLRLRHGDTTWWTWQFPAKLTPGNSTRPIQRVTYTLPLPLGLPKLPYQITLDGQQGDKAEIFQHVALNLPESLLNCCIRLTHWPNQPVETLAGHAFNTALQTIAPLISPVNRPPSVPVQPKPASAAQGPNSTCTFWRGSDIALSDAEFPAQIRYGDPLPVVLTWCKLAGASAGDWETRLSLQSLLGSVAGGSRAAGDPAFPISQWPIGEPVRDPYAFNLPTDLSTGYYRLVMQRYRGEQQLEQVTLGLVQVIGYDTVPLPPAIANPVEGSAGELRLLGYGGPEQWSRGRGIDIHTYWQATATPARDGVLFVHIIGPNGKLIAQDDNIPENGTRNAKTYRTGETLDQTHRVIMPDDAPGGEYKLYAGVYDRNQDCCRWEVNQSGKRPPDDLIYMGSFTLPDLPDATPFDNNLFMPATSK